MKSKNETRVKEASLLEREFLSWIIITKQLYVNLKDCLANFISYFEWANSVQNLQNEKNSWNHCRQFSFNLTNFFIDLTNSKGISRKFFGFAVQRYIARYFIIFCNKIKITVIAARPTSEVRKTKTNVKRCFAARVTVYHEIDQIGYIAQKWPNFCPNYSQRRSNRTVANVLAQKWWKMCVMYGF